MDDDGVLIQRYLGGDADAFEELVRRHQNVLFAFLLGRTRSRPLAEDLLQETFLRMLTHLPEYRHRDRLRSWLFRIAHHLVIDDVRARPPGQVSLDARPARLEGEGPAAGDTLPAPDARRPDRIAEGREEAARARAALDRLVPAQREVVLLRQAGLAFKEIARIQGCSINTALGRMHDAVLILRRALEADA